MGVGVVTEVGGDINVASPDPTAGSSTDRSALDSLLEKAIPHETIGATVSFDLLQFGLYGSVVVIVTSLVALAMPGAESIRHSSFYLLFGGAVADLVTFLRALAIPGIVFGGMLLILDAVLLTVRTPSWSRSLITLQAAAGGFSGVVATAFLALLLLNLVIWIVLIVLFATVCFAFIAAALSGS
jgi:hypothetical protein